MKRVGWTRGLDAWRGERGMRKQGDRENDVERNERILAIERPHPNLLRLYLMRGLLTGPLLVVFLPPLLFRYRTLRYRFDEEGVSMSWGILFRREVNLTYARIQDIHVTSGPLQRWVGLADLHVQTASGSATAEMVIEGLQEYEELRDFLYERMRGARESRAGAHAPPPRPGVPPPEAPAVGRPEAGEPGTGAAIHGSASPADLDELLRAIRDELHGARAALEAIVSGPPPPPAAGQAAGTATTGTAAPDTATPGTTPTELTEKRASTGADGRRDG